MKALSLLLLASLAVGCAPELSSVDTDTCASGLKWTGGDAESPDMHPGRECITCHLDEGPSFVVAGTVYESRKAADDCGGVSDVEVVLTDAEGTTVTLTTTTTGNFYLEDTRLVFPLLASVRAGGYELGMPDVVPHGRCNECHDENSRIFAP